MHSSSFGWLGRGLSRLRSLNLATTGTTTASVKQVTAAPSSAVDRRSLARAPAPLLVLVSIASVQCGSALARGLFDDLGAAGVTLLRLALASLLLLVVLRPRVGRWSRQAWRAAVLLGCVMAGGERRFFPSVPPPPPR